MTKIQFGLVSLFLGISLLGVNLVQLDSVGHSSAGSFFGMWGAFMLIFIAIWDFIDHYSELSSKVKKYGD